MAVDGAGGKTRDLVDAQVRRVGRGQRRPVAQARNRLQKPHDLVSAEHHRQLLRLARGDDALQRLAPAQGDAVEEPQGAHGLIDMRPRPPLRDQVELVGPHFLQPQPVRRAAKMPAELGNRIEVGLLCRRRQIADHHVVDHAPAQRVDLSHRKLLSDEVVQQTNPLRQETPTSAAPYRGAVSFNPQFGGMSHVFGWADVLAGEFSRSLRMPHTWHSLRRWKTPIRTLPSGAIHSPPFQGAGKRIGGFLSSAGFGL